MKTYLLPVVALLLFGSCGSGSDSNGHSDSTNVSTNSKQASVTGVQAYRPQIDQTPWEGDLLDAVYWQDSLGEHALIVSGTGQFNWADQKPELKNKLRKDQEPEKYPNAAEIYGRHYVLKSGAAKWELYYEYYNYILSKTDVVLNYQQKSLIVTDIDSNGVGEALFLYTEAEGDKIAQNDYAGKMILFHDSIARVSVGPIGLAAVNETATKSIEEKIHLVTPENSAFRTFLLNQWDIYFKEQERIDREAITEKNNVDEHGHADHAH